MKQQALTASSFPSSLATLGWCPDVGSEFCYRGLLSMAVDRLPRTVVCETQESRSQNQEQTEGQPVEGKDMRGYRDTVEVLQAVVEQVHRRE